MCERITPDYWTEVCGYVLQFYCGMEGCAWVVCVFCHGKVHKSICWGCSKALLFPVDDIHSYSIHSIENKSRCTFLWALSALAKYASVNNGRNMNLNVVFLSTLASAGSVLHFLTRLGSRHQWETEEDKQPSERSLNLSAGDFIQPSSMIY